MESVSFLKTFATRSSKLLRSNFLNCWGSNQKVRNSSSRLLGFSASVTIFGFGIHAFRNISNDSKIENRWDFDRGRKSIANLRQAFFKGSATPGNLPASRQQFPAISRCDDGVSFFNAIKSLTFLTPVYCSGEDVICNCTVQKSSPSTSVAGNRAEVFNCDCRCGECFPKGGCKADCQQQVCPKAPPPEQCSTSSTCSNNDKKTNNVATAEKGHSSSSPAVSNRPCRTSAACSQVTEIDIDALAQELGGLQQINFVPDTDLSHCFLIKQASQITVDSVTRMLTEAAAAYEDYHAEYRRVLDMMMDNLEESRKACGTELEVLECKVMLIRAKVDEIKRRIKDLDMFLGSLEKLGSASAETAFMANAEYASVAMMERLQSLGIEVKRLRDQSKEKERDLVELQSLIIVESGKSLK